MEQVGNRVISTDHKIEAGLYHIEQQKRNKGKGERDQPAAKEEVIQTQVVEEKIQRIAQEKGLTPLEYVDPIVENFKKLWKKL